MLTLIISLAVALALVLAGCYRLYRIQKEKDAVNEEADARLQRSGPKRILRLDSLEIMNLMDHGPVMRTYLIRHRLVAAGFDLDQEIMEEDRPDACRVYYQDLIPKAGELIWADIPVGTPTDKAEGILKERGFNLDRRLNSKRIGGIIQYWQAYYHPGKKV